MSETKRSTPAGTSGYAERFAGKLSPRNFRNWRGHRIGSIGIGTYLGQHDEESDVAYTAAICEAIKLGANHIDTAINYRCMRSERSVGRALDELFSSGAADREEIFIATKGGYVPFEGTPPLNVRSWIRGTYVESGLLSESDLVGGSHAMAPRFLEDQVSRSLDNLGIECIDLYYLHNPEVHTAALRRDEFRSRLASAMEQLEFEVSRGRIAHYGISSWEAFRTAPDARPHLDLSALIEVAEEVGGKDHHFAAVQLPFNPAMMEGFALNNQPYGGELLSSVEAAARAGLLVVASAPFLQGQLFRAFPPFLAAGMPSIETNAERALQFTRSIPGIDVVLAGTKNVLHVVENLSLARHEPLGEDALMSLFG